MSDGKMNSSSRYIRVGVLSVACLLAVLFARQTWLDSASLNDPSATSRTVTARGELFSDERSTINLFRQASPSVVNITTIGVERDLFTLNLYQIPQGTGSGFVWDRNGDIITNFHVIQNADSAQVTLADQSNWKARVVGVAPDKDLAVLRIDAPANRLRPLPIGTSKDLQVGQSVYAIGNPFGLDQTLTTGVISALNREIESVTRRPIQGVIQSDAAINPGNSGGPLLDSAGRLIGVNTAIYSPSGGNVGIAFAVPAATVESVVASLKKDGSVARGFIGVQIQPVTAEVADAIGLKEPRGALIAEAQANGPAAKAGIKRGDTIIAVNGEKVADARDLSKKIAVFAPGTKTTLTVWREGKEREVSFEVGRQPAA